MERFPNAIDLDSDNDGWPDDVELDRGSNHLMRKATHVMYFGIDTGIFYGGGLTFYGGYTDDALEISLSGLMDIVFEELVILLCWFQFNGTIRFTPQNIQRPNVGYRKCRGLREIKHTEEATNEYVVQTTQSLP